MDAREARIAATFAEAEEAREEASRSVLMCEKKLQDIQSASDEMMNKARAEADAYRRELMDQARKEVDEIQNRWTETLRSERENFFQELRRLTGTQVYAITRRVLKDLADMDLEQRIVQILTERIEMMNREERKRIRTLMTAGEKITIQSAFDIPPEAREKLNGTLQRNIGSGIDVAYEKSDDVMSGYELRINGYKIAWSMKDYLDTLEEKFYHVLYEESQERKQVH
jgi:F-type H+-transporting ATPase subunit b